MGGGGKESEFLFLCFLPRTFVNYSKVKNQLPPSQFFIVERQTKKVQKEGKSYRNTEMK